MANSRSTYRRGGGNYKGHHTNTSPASKGRDFHEGLGKATAALEIPEDNDEDEGLSEITIKKFAYAGSYNWIEAKQPTILVPGSPPIWVDKPLPFAVQPDSGQNFIDQNGFRMGKWPLVPLIQAVETISADRGKRGFDWPSVDFVTDRNGLRKLLRWITGVDGSRDFRIDTQLAGDKTVLLSRWEQLNKEQGERRGISYGFNFETAATVPAPGCGASTGHHRIITYDFDGLKLVVRFEVDAYLPMSPPRSSGARSTVAADAEEDILARALSKLTVESKPSSAPGLLKIITAGEEVPQSSLIEMKTRNPIRFQQLDLRSELPQLWFSQTPYHYVAVHDRGVFQSIRKDELGQGEFVYAEEDVQAGLRKLRVILGSIQQLVKSRGSSGRLTLVCTKGALKVHERKEEETCLPDDLLRLFDGKS